MISGAQALMESLKREHVDHMFGYAGATICPAVDALAHTDIAYTLVRTEQNAGHMASGYARMTGKPGVCMVTSGPGATNLITGIATAYMDSIPLVAITGQVQSYLLGRDIFQEVDITGAVAPFIKHSYLVKDANDIPRMVKEAFHIASTGRQGPVLIDVPVDIQEQMIEPKYPDSVDIRGYKPSVKGNDLQIKRVVEAIARAKQPLICAGGGVWLANARDELLELAERCAIPVVKTMMGLGLVPTDHPLNMGMIGAHGNHCANKALAKADLLIMVGTRAADRAMVDPGEIQRRMATIHIDVDPAEIGKNVGPHIPLVGDCKSIFEDLMEQEITGDFTDWTEQLNYYEATMQRKRNPSPEYVDPAAFIRTISELLPEDAVYVADVGQNQIWSCRNCKIREGSFLTSGGMGTMGYSIPAAMGAKLGAPGRQVVAVCGDGSFQMSMMEFATMRQYQVPVKIVVIANHYLGMVREYQQNTYKGRYSVVELGGGPDLEKLAQAYGMDFIRLEAPDKMDEAIDAFLKDEDAVLMECVINPMDTVK